MRDWMVLVLTTGLRKSESMTITWDQVDMDEKLFYPKNKAKRYLIIPMIGLTYDMFKNVRMIQIKIKLTYLVLQETNQLMMLEKLFKNM